MNILNVQGEDEVAITIKNLLSEKEKQRRVLPSISMVPKLYRDQHPRCFDPQVVCIGPLHREHKNVKEHEGLKVTYLYDLLDRLKKPPKLIMEACFSKVLGSIKEIKECYAVGATEFSDLQLANMMVIDACFILEFLVKRFEAGGLVCPGNRFEMNHITYDLLLLENQIPFFVLQDVFDCTSIVECVRSVSLMKLLLIVLETKNPFKEKLQGDNLHNTTGDRYYYKHILDVMHKAYHPTCVIPTRILTNLISHSAVELDLAGVNFEPNVDGSWQLAMNYEPSGFLCFHRPTFKMPIIHIRDNSELVLKNLIAYEQSSPINGYYFTSYACAMDMLVDSKEDVSKLVESKVIVNHLGSNESAAILINNISDGLYYEEFSYQDQWKRLDKYYNDYWPKNIAWLRRTYFNSPWNMIALVAVILLFVLTVIQTVFTVKSGI